ncbi:MFS monocarboxylate [Mycena chlorophos]|uniref:MFS monocarboxylate n=1 Tax=Mycena chlorophos TaxID=658473 RepID=A0A8H6VRR7_MYCCL|nr:MFS monocarboxylate [Mycena chlorophos]
MASESASAAGTSDEAGKSKTELVLVPEQSVTVEGAPPDVESEFPDGGWRAWMTVFGAFMINFSCYGVGTSFGVFEQHYSANQLKNEPLSNIAWIGSLQLSIVLLLGCFSGPLFDAGYLKLMIASAGALYVFCLFMTSLATEYYQFVLAQGLGVGIAMGMIYSPSMSAIGHHFKKRKILAFGIFSTGASAGGTLIPIAMRRLFDEVGFAWAVRTLAFLVLLCMISGFVFCNSRLPPRKGTRVLDFSVFHDRAYCFIVLGAALIGLGLYAPVTFGVSYAVERGLPQNTAFYSLSVLNAFSVPGRILPNLVAPRIGAVNTLMACCIIASMLCFVWPTTHDTAGIIVFNAAFGMASGGYVSMLAPAITVHTEASRTGVRIGMALFCTSFCWLASSPVQGALINVGRGSYWPVAAFSGGTVIFGVLVIGVARGFYVRKLQRWSV